MGVLKFEVNQILSFFKFDSEILRFYFAELGIRYFSSICYSATSTPFFTIATPPLL
jgi:hypothetical protein